jgi:membrane protease YdiL (CAAX protease family)
MTTIKRYPVAAFVSITFALSGTVSFAPRSDLADADKFLILGALIVSIPTIVALALAAVTGGVRSFLREALNWHVNWRWALIALGLAVGARLLMSILALLTGAISAIEVSAVAPVLIVVIYLFAQREEIGWRGFAVRRLVTYRSAFAALLITGIPWSVSHIFFYLAQSADEASVRAQLRAHSHGHLGLLARRAQGVDCRDPARLTKSLWHPQHQYAGRSDHAVQRLCSHNSWRKGQKGAS